MRVKTIAAAILTGMFLAACGGGTGESGGPAAGHQQFDDSKPYLTDAKIQNVVKVMREQPEEWKKFEKGWNPITAIGAQTELDAFAKKNGFNDFQDYANTVRRVGLGMMQVGMEKAQKNAENLPPELKKMMGEQMGTQLNEADRMIIEKYWKELSEASDDEDGSE